MKIKMTYITFQQEYIPDASSKNDHKYGNTKTERVGYIKLQNLIHTTLPPPLLQTNPPGFKRNTSVNSLVCEHIHLS